MFKNEERELRVKISYYRISSDDTNQQEHSEKIFDVHITAIKHLLPIRKGIGCAFNSFGIVYLCRKNASYCICDGVHLGGIKKYNE